MTFFNVDDNLLGNDKWVSIPRKDRMAAAGLWTFLGSYCAHNLTDGNVPAALVDEMPNGPRLAQILVEAKLWRTVPGGFLYRNWAKYQPTREQEMKRRQKNAERQARFRRNQTGDDSQDELSLVT